MILRVLKSHILKFQIYTLDFPSFQGHVVSLATHPYGSRVIQSIIQNFSPAKCAPIIEEAFQQTENLAQDSYGNFVLHQILEHGRTEDKKKMVETICEKASLLSRHRYANILVQVYC